MRQLFGDTGDFEAYGIAHLIPVLVLLAGAVALVVLGRRPVTDLRRQGKVLAVVLLALTVLLRLLNFLPSEFAVSRSLPMDLCDIAGFLIAYGLWTERGWAVALAYFWGFTLTLNGVLTPTLDNAFPHIQYWMYWASHLSIIWGGVYLVIGRGLGPSWRSYASVVAITAAWAAVVMTGNALLDTNYGYLNGKPAEGSALDLLGPWPWYVLVEVALVSAGWALMTWPWEWVRIRRGRAAAGPGAQGRAEPTGQRG